MLPPKKTEPTLARQHYSTFLLSPPAAKKIVSYPFYDIILHEYAKLFH
jgi:hypothetical protein